MVIKTGITEKQSGINVKKKNAVYIIVMIGKELRYYSETNRFIRQFVTRNTREINKYVKFIFKENRSTTS